MTTYLLGVATPFALAAVVSLVLILISYFTRTSRAYGCGTCDRWWGPDYDGSRSWLAELRREWHRATSHPGYLGRRLVAQWRGSPMSLDRRLSRMFPNPPVTVWDVLARIPFIQSVAFAIATRHGKQKQS